MNNKLQNGINEIKKIQMTIEEKNRIFDNIISTPNLSRQPIKSIWVNPFILMIKRNHLVYYVVIPLIIILASGGVAFASEESLPNSILYPIKVSIIEPIRGALTFSPKNKAQYESNLATKRLVEAETLAGEGRLDKPTENRLNGLLEKHTASLNKALEMTDKKEQTVESIVQTDEIVTNFHANMNAHARVLDMLKGDEEDTQSIEEDQSEDTKISKTARDNAEKIKSNLKDKTEEKVKRNNSEDKKKEKSEEYNKRKEAIQSLIDKTTTELDNVSVPSSSSRQEIIENTNETLKEAKKFLDEADTHEEEGDSEDAYSTLLDSESSVKEAGIFLETGMKFEREDDEREDD